MQECFAVYALPAVGSRFFHILKFSIMVHFQIRFAFNLHQFISAREAHLGQLSGVQLRQLSHMRQVRARLVSHLSGV
jgi:hypothetical protein